MSKVVKKGWGWIPRRGGARQHYFIVTDARPQVVDSLCRRYSTSPGIDLIDEPTPPGVNRDMRFDCAKCREKFLKLQAGKEPHHA